MQSVSCTADITRLQPLTLGNSLCPAVFCAAAHSLSDVKLSGVLLTHLHMGHYLGLMQFGREAMDWQGLQVMPVRLKQIPPAGALSAADVLPCCTHLGGGVAQRQ